MAQLSLNAALASSAAIPLSNRPSFAALIWSTLHDLRTQRVCTVFTLAVSIIAPLASRSQRLLRASRS
jgi:hypothetical protein